MGRGNIQNDTSRMQEIKANVFTMIFETLEHLFSNLDMHHNHLEGWLEHHRVHPLGY